MGENLIHPLMNWLSKLFTKKSPKSEVLSSLSTPVEAIPPNNAPQTLESSAPESLSSDTHDNALNAISVSPENSVVEEDLSDSLTVSSNEQLDISNNSTQSQDHDASQQVSQDLSKEVDVLKVRQTDVPVNELVFASDLNSHSNSNLDGVVEKKNNNSEISLNDNLNELHDLMFDVVSDSIVDNFLGTQERVFEGLRECDPGYSEVLMTTSDKNVVRSVSMKGSDKYAMNEDGHRVGNMPDGRAYSLVCDGTSSPYGSWSFVSSFADQIARFMKTQSPNSPEELNSLVDRAFDECSHTLNTAATVMLAIELKDGSYLVYRNGDSVVAYKDKEGVMYVLNTSDFLVHDLICPDLIGRTRAVSVRDGQITRQQIHHLPESTQAVYLCTDGIDSYRESPLRVRFPTKQLKELASYNFQRLSPPSKFFIIDCLHQETLHSELFSVVKLGDVDQSTYTKMLKQIILEIDGNNDLTFEQLELVRDLLVANYDVEYEKQTVAFLDKFDRDSVAAMEKVKGNATDNVTVSTMKESSIGTMKLPTFDLDDSQIEELGRVTSVHGVQVFARSNKPNYDLTFDYGDYQVDHIMCDCELPQVVQEAMQKLQTLFDQTNDMNPFQKDALVDQFNSMFGAHRRVVTCLNDVSIDSLINYVGLDEAQFEAEMNSMNSENNVRCATAQGKPGESPYLHGNSEAVMSLLYSLKMADKANLKLPEAGLDSESEDLLAWFKDLDESGKKQFLQMLEWQGKLGQFNTWLHSSEVVSILFDQGLLSYLDLNSLSLDNIEPIYRIILNSNDAGVTNRLLKKLKYAPELVAGMSFESFNHYKDRFIGDVETILLPYLKRHKLSSEFLDVYSADRFVMCCVVNNWSDVIGSNTFKSTCAFDLAWYCAQQNAFDFSTFESYFDESFIDNFKKAMKEAGNVKLMFNNLSFQDMFFSKIALADNMKDYLAKDNYKNAAVAYLLRQDDPCAQFDFETFERAIAVRNDQEFWDSYLVNNQLSYYELLRVREESNLSCLYYSFTKLQIEFSCCDFGFLEVFVDYVLKHNDDKYNKLVVSKLNDLIKLTSNDLANPLIVNPRLYPLVAKYVAALPEGSKKELLPASVNLRPRINWKSGQIQMISSSNGRPYDYYHAGEYIISFNQMLSVLQKSKVKLSDSQKEFLDNFVQSNSDLFKVLDPTSLVDKWLFPIVSAKASMREMRHTIDLKMQRVCGVAMWGVMSSLIGAVGYTVFRNYLIDCAEGAEDLTGWLCSEVEEPTKEVKQLTLEVKQLTLEVKQLTPEVVTEFDKSKPAISQDVSKQVEQTLTGFPQAGPVRTEIDFANDVQNPSYVDLEGVQDLHELRMIDEAWTLDSLLSQPQALVDMRQNWDFTQADSLSDVYAIDGQGLEALNQDMNALPDSNFAGQEVEVDTLGDRLLARDENGEIVKEKSGLFRRVKSVGAEDGSSLTLKGESKIFKVYDKGGMKAIRYFKASDGHYYAGCYLKTV